MMSYQGFLAVSNVVVVSIVLSSAVIVVKLLSGSLDALDGGNAAFCKSATVGGSCP